MMDRSRRIFVPHPLRPAGCDPVFLLLSRKDGLSALKVFSPYSIERRVKRISDSELPPLKKHRFIEGLEVDRAFTIFNRYLTAFEGASYSRKVIGEEAHPFLFEMLRLGLQKFNEDMERQWAQWTNSEQDGGGQPATRSESK